MKILVTGTAGQVGWELARILPQHGDVVAIDLQEMDLTRPDEIRRVLSEVKPDIVVNPAAYTAVDKAESEPDVARLVNAVAPALMAEELRKSGGLLIHYSTDYVFDGTKNGAYEESDTPNPLSVYGATKRDGERAIQEVDGAHVILRTSWVYGARGKNFLLTMLRLFEERDELKIVDDQIGAPTWSRWIAQTTSNILAQCIQGRDTWSDAKWRGVYHLTSGDSTSWFGFAQTILDLSGAQTKPRLISIKTNEYPLPAKRPANSLLNNAKIAASFGIAQKPWSHFLRECMAELK